ncbi:MAG: hypothetical protein ACEQSB_02830, partial [Undibacterium sp.]
MQIARRALRQKSSARSVSTAPLWRLYFFRGILFFAGIVIIGRLYMLQVVGREKWVAMAEDQHTIAQALRAERGSVSLRDGDLT